MKWLSSSEIFQCRASHYISQNGRPAILDDGRVSRSESLIVIDYYFSSASLDKL